jgi:hypothetical protein
MGTLVMTHNDELKWYEDIAQASSNPLARLVARQSIAWLEKEVPRLSRKSLFVHVSEYDRAGYDRLVPGHRHVIAGIGTDISARLTPAPQETGRVTLSFVSALGVKVGADALSHFHTHFEPALRQAFGSHLTIQIIGSQPTPQIEQLCAGNQWQLFPNVSDERLEELLAATTFTLLPFPYSTGVKLKLFRSLGSGIPFLSTKASEPAGFDRPPFCCFSDEPAVWVETIRQYQAAPEPDKIREELLQIGQTYSWPSVVGRLVNDIKVALADKHKNNP